MENFNPKPNFFKTKKGIMVMVATSVIILGGLYSFLGGEQGKGSFSNFPKGADVENQEDENESIESNAAECTINLTSKDKKLTWTSSNNCLNTEKIYLAKFYSTQKANSYNPTKKIQDSGGISENISNLEEKTIQPETQTVYYLITDNIQKVKSNVVEVQVQECPVDAFWNNTEGICENFEYEDVASCDLIKDIIADDTGEKYKLNPLTAIKLIGENEKCKKQAAALQETPVPQNLKIKLITLKNGAGIVELTWTAVPKAGYAVYRFDGKADSTQGNWKKLIQTKGGMPVYGDPAIDKKKPYSYYVTAVKEGVESLPSKIVIYEPKK